MSERGQVDQPDGRPGPDLSHVRTMWDADEASRALGIEILRLGVDDSIPTPLGHARTRMPVVQQMVNGHDIAHGGYIFALADSTFALACNATGQLTVAAGGDVGDVRPGRLGDVLVADARERVRFGRSGLADVTVTREADGAVIAEFRGRSRTLPARQEPPR